MKNFRIDFIGIGAEKAGTTWLADCLREHPEVFIPDQKELFFFNDYDPHFLAIKNYRFRRGLSWYKRQFSGGVKKIKGEISPTYLYSKVTAERIKNSFSDVKFIVILREPISRALSQYIHDKRLGIIKDVSFDEAIRIYSNYIEKGLYYKYLSEYAKLFGKEKILVLVYEDLQKNPKGSIKNIYSFLGLKNTTFVPPSLNKKSNIARQAKYPYINYAMVQLDYFLRIKKLDVILKIIDSLGIRRLAIYLRDLNATSLDNYPRVNPETETYLKNVYKEEIQKLEKLIGKSFKDWLT